MKHKFYNQGRKKIAILFAVLLLFVGAGTAVAQVDETGIENPGYKYLADIGDFGTLLLGIVSLLLYFAGGVAVLFLLVGGYQYITAHGNEQAAEKAKRTLLGAVIGLLIIIMAFAIVTIVSDTVTHDPDVANGPPVPDPGFCKGPPDEDGDGVTDVCDMCPDSPPGPVTDDGCPIPPYAEGNYEASYYFQAYYQASYYSQGLYEATYYTQGYYEASYYSQGLYEGAYYTQGYYEASYYSQGLYEATYYTQGYYEGAYTPPAQCEDVIDNDGDSLIDFPADSGCDSPSDDNEIDTFYLEYDPGPYHCIDGVNHFVQIGTIKGGVAPYFWGGATIPIPSPSHIFINGPDKLTIECLVPPGEMGSGIASVTLYDSAAAAFKPAFPVSWGP